MEKVFVLLNGTEYVKCANHHCPHCGVKGHLWTCVDDRDYSMGDHYSCRSCRKTHYFLDLGDATPEEIQIFEQLTGAIAAGVQVEHLPEIFDPFIPPGGIAGFLEQKMKDASNRMIEILAEQAFDPGRLLGGRNMTHGRPTRT